MLKKFFKLDEPLGRAGFAIVAFVLIVASNIIYAISEFYFKDVDVLLLLLFPVLMVSVVKRLKDIDANEFLMGFFLFPFFSWLFFTIILIYDLKILPYPFVVYSGIIVILNFLGLYPFLIFLFWRKGKKDNVYYEKSHGFRKNTIVISVYFMCVFFVSFGTICLGEYQIYLGKKAAMEIIQVLDKFKTEKGYYPEKIEELVPDYVSEVPINENARFAFGNYSYHAKGKGNQYSIIVDSFTFQYTSYWSNSRVWTE